MNKKVIEVTNLRKTYGSVVAVEEISFEVYEGEIFGMVGPNGAGKTTTVECVEGIRKPDMGELNKKSRVQAHCNRLFVYLSSFPKNS